MSSTKIARSPSVEAADPNTADSKISEEDQLTQSEEEFMSGHDEPKTTEKCSRNLTENTV